MKLEEKIRYWLEDNQYNMLLFIMAVIIIMFAAVETTRGPYSYDPPQAISENVTPTPTPTATPTPTPVEEPLMIAEYDEAEVRLLASIIQSEAGNQCLAGQQAVGIVVMNRVEDDIYFPDTIEEVVYAPGQFTPAGNGILNQALYQYDTEILPETCIEAAKYALDGNKTVRYNGVTYKISYFYFNGYLQNAELRIQDHDFA